MLSDNPVGSTLFLQEAYFWKVVSVFSIKCLCVSYFLPKFVANSKPKAFMKKLFACLLLGWCLAVNAGTTLPDMKFRRLDTRDGLSNSQINYIFQDSKGIIWIGTSYGLNRYDGYRFRTFYSDPNDTTTLRNNYVEAGHELQYFRSGHGKGES